MWPNKMMEEVWRWKDEAAGKTDGMTVQELLAYYNRAEQRLAEKTGGGILNLPRIPKRENRRVNAGR
jgi:hypothetical protein